MPILHTILIFLIRFIWRLIHLNLFILNNLQTVWIFLCKTRTIFRIILFFLPEIWSYLKIIFININWIYMKPGIKMQTICYLFNVQSRRIGCLKSKNVFLWIFLNLKKWKIFPLPVFFFIIFSWPEIILAKQLFKMVKRALIKN